MRNTYPTWLIQIVFESSECCASPKCSDFQKCWILRFLWCFEKKCDFRSWASLQHLEYPKNLVKIYIFCYILFRLMRLCYEFLGVFNTFYRHKNREIQYYWMCEHWGDAQDSQDSKTKLNYWSWISIAHYLEFFVALVTLVTSLYNFSWKQENHIFIDFFGYSRCCKLA